MIKLLQRAQVWCFLLLLAGTSAYGQQYLFDHFSTREGLANDVINNVYQDKKGFIYISTNAGLTVYDGSVFRTMPLRTSGGKQPIIKCQLLANGKIWVNYAGNKDLILVENETATNVGLPSATRMTINNIVEGVGPGRMICSDQGLFEWKNDTVQSIAAGLTDNNRLSMDIIPISDSLLLITRKGVPTGLIDRHTYKKIAETQLAYSVTSWAKDNEGNVWLATDNYGLCLIDGQALLQSKIVFRPLPAPISFLQKEDILCVKKTDAGSILIGTYHYGLVNWDSKGGLTIYNTSNGLSSNSVKSILIDQDNNWWIGTNNGLDRLSNKNFRLYNKTFGLEPGAMYFTDKDKQDRIWFFNNDKLYYLANNVYGALDYPEGAEKICLQSAVSRRGIWVVAPNNLFLIETNAIRPRVAVSIATNDVHRRILQLDDDRMLLGGKNMLSLLDNDRLQLITDSIKDITALHKDRFGHIWVGTFERGIYRLAYDRASKSFKFLQRIAYENKFYPRINCFYEDLSGHIWAGTRFDGALIFQADSMQAVRVATLTEKEGMANNYVTTICATSAHTIWAGHNTGFDKITTLNGKYIIEKTSDFYSFNNSVRKLLPDGNGIWGASDIGAFYFSVISERKTNPVVFLKEISFPDTSYQLFTTDTSIRLKPYQNSFAVSFTAPFYFNEKQTRYFYRLDKKSETGWIEIKGNHSINFNSLQPGDYVLEIKAVAFNGQETLHRAKLLLHLAAPFYRTGWFISLAILTLLAFGYSLYQYRIRELKKLYLIRDNISRNLHDEIGATLSSINIYSDIARKKPIQHPEATQLMERIYSGSEQVMNSMNDIVWFVNPKNDTLDNIVVRMREYCIPVLEAKNIAIIFETDDNIATEKLSMEQRQHIYYIFKEAINNMVKYARASQATIRMSKKGKMLVLLIEDNGQGFDSNRPDTGNGLDNMKKRAELIHGQLEIRSAIGKGTVITLQVAIA